MPERGGNPSGGAELLLSWEAIRLLQALGSLDVILAGPPGGGGRDPPEIRVQIPWLRLNDSVVFGLQPVPLKLYWHLLNVVSKILKCT